MENYTTLQQRRNDLLKVKQSAIHKGDKPTAETANSEIKTLNKELRQLQKAKFYKKK